MTATWQVEFDVVPRRALAAHAPASKKGTPGSASWWTMAHLPADYRLRLASVAPVGRSSSDDLERWGTDDGNRVDVWTTGGQVSRVQVGVDVRRPDPRFGAALLAFLRAADAVLVRSDGLVAEATINAYSMALRTSAAWRLTSDPSALLTRLPGDDGVDD